jgi:hypothetical protein
MRRWVLLGAIVAAGCGGSNPSAPSPTPLGGGLPFQATRYNLNILGLECGGSSQPFPSVLIAVTLTPDATGWTAVPEKANGTLSLRFQPGPSSGLTSIVPLAGSARGFADAEGPGGTPLPSPTRVTIDAAVPLSGVLLLNDLASGSFDGPVVFSGAGTNATCTGGSARWFLNKFNIS